MARQTLNRRRPQLTADLRCRRSGDSQLDPTHTAIGLHLDQLLNDRSLTSQDVEPCDAAGIKTFSRMTSPHVSPSGESGFMYEANFYLATVPAGGGDIGFELTTFGIQGREEHQRRLTFPIIAPTDVATMWGLLPPGVSYRDVDLVSYDPTNPSKVESVEPTYRFDMADGSLFCWMLVAPRDGHMYECRWELRNE